MLLMIKKALSIADRLVVLNNGHVQQLGTPEEFTEIRIAGSSNFIGEVFLEGEVTLYDDNIVTCVLRLERLQVGVHRLELSSGRKCS